MAVMTLQSCFACLVLSMPAFALAADEAPDTQALAGKVLARYESLRSYRDTSTHEKKLAGMSVRGRASTAYVAPDRVLVVGEVGPATRVLEIRGESYRSWSKDKGWEEETPTLFFSGLTGISAWIGDAPPIVLGLFFPQDSYQAPMREWLPKAERLPDKSTDGVRCHRLRGAYGKRTLEVWIGVDDLLIRRIDESSDLATGITRIKPQADARITEEELQREIKRRTGA